MTIHTPQHGGVLWAAANVSLLAMIPAAMLYFQRELRAGAYPVEADSIGIPILGTAMWVLILLLPLNGVCWLSLRRHAGKVALNISAKGLGPGASLSAGLGIVFAVLFAALAAWTLLDRAPEFTIVLLLWSYVTLAMRAAFVASVRARAHSV